MLQIKKQFQPSLDTISEVLELDQLSIIKPIIRDGFIRREVGFLSSWKQRIFAILFQPNSKLTCQVYHRGNGQPEEIINLGDAKLSKKCSEVDGYLCFGVVTVQNQKCLITLKSSRDCFKIFYEIVSAKKMLKNSMFRNSQLKCKPFHKEAQRSSLLSQNLNKKQHFRDEVGSVRTEGEQFERTSYGNARLSKEVQHFVNKEEQINDDSQSQSPFRKNRRESITLKPEIKQIQRRLSQIRYPDKQEQKIDPLDRQDFFKLQNFQGFKPVQQFENGIIYQNKDVIKVKTSINFNQSARIIMELFIHLDNWNSKIRQFITLNPIEKGVNKVYIQFFKKGCFSRERYCQAISSLYKIEDGFFLTMRSLSSIPSSLKKENWINFKLAIQVTQKQNSQKKMVFSVESDENSKFLLHFVEQIKTFSKYLKPGLKLPEKLLEVKTSLEKLVE